MMNIAKYSLENTKVVYFFLAILLVGGVLSFDLLGKKEDSPFVIKTAVIITRYPGATPNEVEQLITEPIEREIQSMRRVHKIKSDSYYGMSKIQIELSPATPPEEMPQMWDELRRKVLNIQPSLPQGASTISVSDDFGDVFGIYYGLTAGEAAARIDKALKDIYLEPLYVLRGKYNPPNYWGSVDSAIAWLKLIYDYCREHPDYIVRERS